MLSKAGSSPPQMTGSHSLGMISSGPTTIAGEEAVEVGEAHAVLGRASDSRKASRASRSTGPAGESGIGHGGVGPWCSAQDGTAERRASKATAHSQRCRGSMIPSPGWRSAHSPHCHLGADQLFGPSRLPARRASSAPHLTARPAMPPASVYVPGNYPRSDPEGRALSRGAHHTRNRSTAPAAGAARGCDTPAHAPYRVRHPVDPQRWAPLRQ